MSERACHWKKIPFLILQLVKDNSSFDCCLVLDALQSLAKLLKFECLVDNTLRFLPCLSPSRQWSRLYYC